MYEVETSGSQHVGTVSYLWELQDTVAVFPRTITLSRSVKCPRDDADQINLAEEMWVLAYPLLSNIAMPYQRESAVVEGKAAQH